MLVANTSKPRSQAKSITFVFITATHTNKLLQPDDAAAEAEVFVVLVANTCKAMHTLVHTHTHSHTQILARTHK